MNVDDLNKLMSGLKGGLNQVMPEGMGSIDEEIETESGGGGRHPRCRQQH